MLNANITAKLYAGEDPHFHFLCVDTCGIGLMKSGNVYVNRFLGVPQLTTLDEVRRVLGQFPRVWFVVKQSDWENDKRLPPDIRAEIGSRMEVIFTSNATQVFLSRASGNR